MLEWIGVFAWLLGAVAGTAPPQVELPPAAAGDEAAPEAAMPRLARLMMKLYREEDRLVYLDNLFRMQLVAGQVAESRQTLLSLHALRGNGVAAPADASNAVYEIFARAKAGQGEDGSGFAAAFRRSFRESLGAMDDRTAALVMRALTFDPLSLRQDLDEGLAKLKAGKALSQPEALALIRAYQVADTYRMVAPLTADLIAEDDRRRYQVDKDVAVRTPDGATVCALVVRPRAASGRLPTLLNFTIYADPNDNLSDARRTAANGYAGVVGLTRGKGCSPDRPVPYEHDGADAAALIDWIGAQAWSDGRVGMYGGSYEGFTQWAAAKHHPPALKAIMPSVAVAPGIDVPMDNGLFLSFVYPWPFYTTDVKGLDAAVYDDRQRWRRLNREWYVSGRAYRELDQIDGTPNPIFDRWIAHPTYDAYWQSMIPYRQEFARIDIPVLQTAGYYYGGPGAAVYYFTQHHKYDPAAEHYLVIGPYDHRGGQRGTVGRLGDTVRSLAGYELDPAALIDVVELRYQWFEYLFRGGRKPALLQDKVNYQVTGANVWKHAPSFAAMADRKLRLHFSAARSGNAYRLSKRRPAHGGAIALTVDLAGRSDADRVAPGGGVVDQALDTADGVELVSAALPQPIELSGLFSGRLELIANKRDFDLNVGLFELTAKGEYVQLSAYWARASQVGDHPGHRRLLTPGRRRRLDFESERLMSHRCRRGSRRVAVVSVIKQPGMQINYGTGKDVSDETIADAKEPLIVQWLAGSFIDLPARR